MKALTVRQPWAWAIIHGGKTTENRTRNLAGSYRGPIAIHAGLQLDDEGLNAEPIQDAFAHLDSTWELEQHLLNVGVIVGVVDLVDVHTAEDELLVDGLGTPACCESKWAEFEHTEIRRLCDAEPTRISNRVHLVLENPRPLAQPIACRGRLGLWTPPAEVLAWIEHDLGSVA